MIRVEHVTVAIEELIKGSVATPEDKCECEFFASDESSSSGFIL